MKPGPESISVCIGSSGSPSVDSLVAGGWWLLLPAFRRLRGVAGPRRSVSSWLVCVIAGVPEGMLHSDGVTMLVARGLEG